MKTLLTLLLLLLTSISQATNYYFSSSGDDSYSQQQAQNPATPWKTLNKLNSIFGELQPGDAVLLKRGDVFRGTITISASGSAANPILVAAYGTGANPIITGFSRLDKWSAAGNGIWVTAVAVDAGESINTLLLNGAMQPLGRFPNRNAANGGYLIYETYSGSSSITDQQLSSSPQWNNAEIIIRKNRWVLDRNKVEAHAGSTVTYKSETGYYGTNNYGYFFQNHPATLDQTGEWYYDQGRQTLGIYLGSQNPSAFAIDAARSPTLVSISQKHHIVFKNLDLTGSNVSTFQLIEAQGISIENCNLLHAGTNAVNANNTSNLVIRNSLFEGTNNIAFNGDNCSNTILSNNRFINTAIHPGMGKGNSGSYEAILLSGNNNLIEYNTINNTGYIPVTFSGSAVTVKNNVISNFALVKDDGGGIYTWNNSTNPPVNADRKIIGNIISKGRGAGEGTDHPNQAQVHGIYIDDNADHVVVQGNTVSECAATGIFLHNAHDISLFGNTLYNNSRQLLMEHDNIAPNVPIRNITSVGNIFFSKSPGQTVAEYKSRRNDLGDFGFFDSNYYCRPLNTELVINTLYQNNGTYYAPSYDLQGWSAAYNKDLHSVETPLRIPSFTVTGVVGNNRYANGSFDENTNGLYAFASQNNCAPSWGSDGGLDGGSLKIAFNSVTSPGNKASVIIGVGSLTGGKTYLLKFTMKGGAESKNIEAFLRKSLSPYNDLSERKASSIKGARKEEAFLFTATNTENDASIVFDVPESTSPLYLDNVHLQEVTATATNPDDYLRFETNETGSAKTIALDGTYTDPRGLSYSGSITLAPYSSAVLGKKNPQAPQSENIPPAANAGSDLTVALPVSTVTLAGSASDADGTIATYTWQKIAGPAPYAFGDSAAARVVVNNLATGSYTFRLTVIDNKGASHSDEVNVTVTPAASAILLPRKVEAENWYRMSGVATENTTDIGGGKNVGWIEKDDWMEYSLNALTGGNYMVAFRVAAFSSGAQLKLLKEDGTELKTVSVPQTGGYQTWQTVHSVVTLLPGVQTVRIVSTSSVEWNINWIDFSLGIPLPPTSSTKIEAEKWSSMSGVLTENTTDAGGGLNVGWIDKGDWMEFPVTIAETGTYTFHLRIAAENTGAQIQINTAAGTLIGMATIPNTGGYQAWQTVTVALPLVQGEQVIRLTSVNTVNWNINWMEVGQPTESGSTRIEAEKYTAMKGVLTENTTDEGAGLNVGWIDNGDWMEYSLKVPSAGVYTLKLRVATPGNGAQLQVRKQDGMPLLSQTLPNTGGYQSWQTVNATVTLLEGTQTLRVFSISDTYWNLNWMELSAIEGAVGENSKELGAAAVTRERENPVNEQGMAMELYPNPARNTLNVAFKFGPATPGVRLELYAASGSLLQVYPLLPGHRTMVLNIAALKNGVYLVRMVAGRKVTEQRFIKQP